MAEQPTNLTTRDQVARLATLGISDNDMAEMLGVSRQRVARLRKQQGIPFVPGVQQYPYERTCIISRDGEHTFMSTRYAHNRCDQHRMHMRECDLCGNQYKTNGLSTTCHPCRNRANAVRQRQRNKIQEGAV